MKVSRSGLYVVLSKDNLQSGIPEPSLSLKFMELSIIVTKYQWNENTVNKVDIDMYGLSDTTLYSM